MFETAKKSLAPALVALLVGGCSMMPHEKATAPELPTAWRDAPVGATTSLADWWTQFQDPLLNRLVAIKFLPDELIHENAVFERFRREARTASALNHANICMIHEIDDQHRQVFIAMEYLDGMTLKHRNRQSSDGYGSDSLACNRDC